MGDPRLFISYRRDDSAGYAGRVYDRLAREFGRDHLVMDIDSIPLGADFVRVLGAEVVKCDVLLAIIGPNWLDARDEDSKLRLEDPNDFVRIEIAAALKRDIPVIPILLEGTRIPKADGLPDDLKKLSMRHALNVRHVSFLDDMERLIRGLRRAQSPQQPEQAAPSLVDKSPQQPAEEDAQRKAAEEAEATRKAGPAGTDKRAKGTFLRFGVLLGAGAIGVLVFAWVAAHRVGVPVPWQSGPTETPSSENLAAAFSAAAEKAAAEKAAAEKAAAEAEARRKAEGISIIEGAAVDGAYYRAIPAVTAIEDCSEQCIRDRQCEMFAYWNNKFCSLYNEYFSTYPTPAAKVGYLRGSKAEQQRLAALKAEESRKAAEKAAAEKVARPDPGLSVQPGSGESFRDRLANGQPCPMCPEMVVVPNGRFVMGSPESEPQRDSERENQVSVSIANPFAVGKFAVTRGEFAVFVEDAGYKTDDGCFTWSGSGYELQANKSWRNPGFAQDDRDPVVCVNWTDAKTYVQWLSRKTGKTYRLLSESEREYVTRAGITTPFWWGNSITSSQANYAGIYEYAGGGSTGEFRRQTVPVDSFKPNPWGLYNVHGNVWNWTEDCWNESNSGNPGNGSARETGECKRRVVRGGSWVDGPRWLRSASRGRFTTGDPRHTLGFRVGRTLTP